MDINIIISGNLTGFSRFYATPNANDIYADAKFDFDYRNFLTFLNNGEKAYAISFAPHVVSVSLITRILDSFRRPGILVVSVLLQRGMIVDSIMNPQNRNAIYQLLNDINDKFYERNFMNGMINQNAAVLMQDYYSDILSNYRLTSDINQRKINGNIDVNTPNKRLGYIASNDIDMPLYLSSLYRRSYEGFHHVFFATNAPQNIEETPEEVVMYRVYITNNKMTLPTLVKLTDQIYKLNPNLGEIGFDQNYTYGDVLQGKAGTQIRASIVGETLEVSYRFKEEEKTIHFVFEDKGNIVSLTHIAPVIVETDGTKVPISTESFKFIGKEIYGRKILQSTNPQYSIRTEYSTIDLQRLSDGATCHIQVESSCVLEMRFSYPYDVPKTIKLKRRNTNQGITIPNVTSYLNRPLPGDLTEWDYTIESKEYQTASGHLGNQQQLILHPKPVTNAPVTTVRPGNNMSHDTSIKNVSQKGTLKLSDGSDNKKGSTKDNKLNIKKVLLVAMPLFVILLYVGISWQFNIWPWDNDSLETKFKPVEENSPTEPKIEQEHNVTKTVKFTFLDAYSTPEKIDKDYINDLILKGIIKLECKLGDSINKPNILDLSTFNISANDNNSDIVKLVISINDINITDNIFKKRFDSLAETQDEDIQLNVLESEIKLYVKIFDYIEQNIEMSYNDWNNLKTQVESKARKSKNTDFIACMLDLVNRKIRHKGNDVNVSHDINVNDLEKWDISSEEIEKWNNIIKENLDIGNQIIGGKTKVKARVGALKTMITYIRKGERPNHDNLSDQQREVIKAIFDAKYKTRQGEKSVQERLTKSPEMFKNTTSLKTFKENIQGITTIYKSIPWPEFTNK